MLSKKLEVSSYAAAQGFYQPRRNKLDLRIHKGGEALGNNPVIHLTFQKIKVQIKSNFSVPDCYRMNCPHANALSETKETTPELQLSPLYLIQEIQPKIQNNHTCKTEIE